MPVGANKPILTETQPFFDDFRTLACDDPNAAKGTRHYDARCGSKTFLQKTSPFRRPTEPLKPYAFSTRRTDEDHL